jgi:hypothetical protein
VENEILQQILTTVQNMQSDIKELKEGQIRIEEKLNQIYNRTSDLDEFEADTKNKLEDIQIDINCINIKVIKNDNNMIALNRKINTKAN